jgi:hypothetical protein
VIPGQVHTTAPDKRPLKQEDVAYLGPSSQGAVGAVVCQKCYNRRTTAKRKEAEAKGIRPRARNCGTDTIGTQLELQVKKLERKLRQSEAGRRTALRQLNGSSNAGVLPTSSHVRESDWCCAGWNILTAEKTRYKYTKEAVDFIEARVKQAVSIQAVPALFLAQPVFMELEPTEVVAPLAVALGDVLKSRRMKPHVAAALKRAGFAQPSTPAAKAAATNSANASDRTGQKRPLIDADTAVEFKYSAGIDSYNCADKKRNCDRAV